MLYYAKQSRKEIRWRTNGQPLKSTFKDERVMESSLFPITDMITWIFWEYCNWLAKRTIGWPIAVSREAHKFVLISPTARPLDSCADEDINNDVGSLDVEIIDKNRSYYKCTMCGRKLSRKQRLKTHSEQAWLLCWSLCWSVSVKHDPSDDPGNRKWRFDAKGKPSRSNLCQRKKLKRKLESYNNADEKRRPDVFNFEPVLISLTTVTVEFQCM